MYDICMHNTEKYEMKCFAQICMTDKHAQLNKNFEERKKCISNPNPNLFFFVSFFIFFCRVTQSQSSFIQ